MSEDKKYFERGDIACVGSYPDAAGVQAEFPTAKRAKLYEVLAGVGANMVEAQRAEESCRHRWQTYRRELREVLFPPTPPNSGFIIHDNFSRRESERNDEMVLAAALRMIEQGQQLPEAEARITQLEKEQEALQDAAYELQQLLAKSIAAVRGLAPMLEGATPNMTPGTVKTLDAVFTPRRASYDEEPCRD